MIDAEYWEGRKLKLMDRDELEGAYLAVFDQRNKAWEDLGEMEIAEGVLKLYVEFLENKVTELQKKVAELEYKKDVFKEKLAEELDKRETNNENNVQM